MLAVSLSKILFSPAGRIVLLAAAFVGWTAFQRHDAMADEKDRLTALYEREKAVELARQGEASAAAIRAAEARAVQAEAQAAGFQEVADELKAELLASGRTCPIDDSVRRRLLQIK